MFSFDPRPGKRITMPHLQNRLVEGSIQSIRLPHASALLLGGIIVVLLAVVAYAVQREFAAQPAGDTSASAVSSVPVRVLSAE